MNKRQMKKSIAWSYKRCRRAGAELTKDTLKVKRPRRFNDLRTYGRRADRWFFESCV